MKTVPPPPSLDPAQQAAEAKRLAQQHGFSLSGIALVPPDGASPRALELEHWLQRGLHGPLDYMTASRQTRTKLRSRFPWARSVLTLGAFYDSAEHGTPGHDLAPHISRYARGRDYHRVFQRRLKALLLNLRAAGVCTQGRYYVDTGPVLERAWAEASGLGWIGKNACLINPRLGSFFLLAEIVLDTAPEPNAPATAHCGTCRRCLDACPTQAFAGPGLLDANRCLVTYNIEMHGQTPPEFWSSQGAWAAGCDICQTVCPYNAPRRLPVPDSELAAPLPWQKMSLADCIVMTQAQFDHAFAASTLRRTGLSGLRLGAITVAGNLKSVSCRAALQLCLTDPDPEIRSRAEWALAQY